MKYVMHPLGNSRGTIAVVTAVFIVVLLAMGAAAIDIGHALVARNELQNVSDAAALAGDRALAIIYQGMSSTAQQSYVVTAANRGTIVAAAQATAVANSAAGVAITVNAADVSVGTWNFATRTFTPTNTTPTAVRVIARRDSSANGPISTFMANVVGMSSVSVNAVATANLGPLNSVLPPATMNAPFGISLRYFNSGFGCGSQVQFAPNNAGTPQSCAGWTTFDQNFNANDMKSIINGMINGTYTSPPTTAGQSSLNFGNGNIGAAWSRLTTLFNQETANGNTWDAVVPVYGTGAASDCMPSGLLPIDGFATVRITYVGGPGNPNNSLNCTGNASPGCVTAVIQCNVFGGTAGGGPPFGPTFATIPGLVE
ncbi:MAG TPA: pilus assembly protein TadG-related protein [Nitrospira sp.]|nr:pilus assembly protein TadG-related protein [Nitrospira sp.]